MWVADERRLSCLSGSTTKKNMGGRQSRSKMWHLQILMGAKQIS